MTIEYYPSLSQTEFDNSDALRDAFIEDAIQLRQRMVLSKTGIISPISCDISPDQNGQIDTYEINLVNDRDVSRWPSIRASSSPGLLSDRTCIEVAKVSLDAEGDIIWKYFLFGVAADQQTIVSLERFMTGSNRKLQPDEDDLSTFRVIIQDGMDLLKSTMR
jgi:hypothetical protein